MFERARSRVGTLALAVVAGALGVLVLAGSGSAAAPGCGSFAAQGDAQDAFLAGGGSPKRNLGGMDPDGDGVACEDLPAPYRGYATIGYNRKRQFFYGTATMPIDPAGSEAPCLYGDRHYDDGARSIHVFRVTPDGDKPLFDEYGRYAQALPESGRLIWKAEKAHPLPGRYYATFEERVRTTPYGRNECPGFSTRPTLLPRPKKN